MNAKPITHDDVVRLFGGLEDHTVAEILATGASYEELEEAAAWLAQEDDVMGEMERPLTGAAGRVYELVSRETEEDENGARR